MALSVPPAVPLETTPLWIGVSVGLWAPSLENFEPGRNCKALTESLTPRSRLGQGLCGLKGVGAKGG